MSRWRALPAELDPSVRRLVESLRRLKDQSGLSLRQLAARTEYSAKSWERYLGGRTLPPREAVEALARVGDEDPVRLLALREVAAQAWGAARTPVQDGRTTDGPEPDPGPEPGPEQGDLTPAAPPGAGPSAPRSLRTALVAGSVALVLAIGSAAILAVRLTDGPGGETGTVPPPPAPSSSAAAATPEQPAYACQMLRADGRWYAGISRVTGETLSYGDISPEVAEAQCLLRRQGISPGGIDGIFGPLTEKAVKELQRRSHLVVDGIIGPHTWKALRG
ncbi:peptidoglycan-binding protein [Streptomyces sp. ACT015]|uniref:peptidoglycan-binding protein n=1 Tax=Streptomyces sp. ACT015 TaxID=3134807 RepID=UPI003D17CD67